MVAGYTSHADIFLCLAPILEGFVIRSSTEKIERTLEIDGG
jgi:hypothetical protein